MDRRTFIKSMICAGIGAPLQDAVASESRPAPADWRLPEDALVSFGMVTDVHFADIPENRCEPPIGDRFYREAAGKLREAVDAMNRIKPDFFIELGDFKDFSADRPRTLACLEKIEREFARFRGERFHVLGNHDFDCLTPDEFLSRISNSGQERALAHYSFTRKGATFIVLDACYDSSYRHYSKSNPWQDANIPPEELTWFESELEKARGPVVVFCHQRLDPHADIRHRVKNAGAVRALMEKSGKTKAVFTGHEHFGDALTLNGIAYYSLRALAVGTGAGENSYAVASLCADGAVRIKGWQKAETANWQANVLKRP